MNTRNKLYKKKYRGKTKGKGKLLRKTSKIYRKSKLRKYRITRKHIYKAKGGCGCSIPLQGGGGSAYTMASFPDNNNTHVSTSWNGNLSSWPGVQSPHSGSWLSYNPMKIDLQTGPGIVQENLIENQFTNEKANPNFVGGQKQPQNVGSDLLRKRRRGRSLKGGNVLGNLYQNVKFGVGSAYNTLYGYDQPINPSPYVQNKLTESTLRYFH